MAMASSMEVPNQGLNRAAYGRVHDVKIILSIEVEVMQTEDIVELSRYGFEPGLPYLHGFGVFAHLVQRSSAIQLFVNFGSPKIVLF